MQQQADLLHWMDRKPTLQILRNRRMQDRDIFNMARKGEIDLTRDEVLELHYGSASAGQFFTPDPAAKLVAALGDIQRGEAVLDPSAGLGNLMLPALKYTDNVKGIELLWDTQELAVNNLGLDIQRANALEADWCDPDVIVMNPPFGAFNKGDKPDWYPFKGRANKETAFLYLALQRAKRRVVSILPNSLLANNEDKPIRSYVMENYGLRASIDLPQKTFWKSAREVNKWKWPTTTVHTGILIIDKKKPDGNYDIFMATPKTVDDLEQVIKEWHSFSQR